MQKYIPQFYVRTPEPDLRGSDLDNFLGSKGSPLCGLGDILVAVTRCYKVNPIFFLALIILESAWGKSKFAKDRYNLCGWGAVDSDPDKAWRFHNREECIVTVCKYLDKNYLLKRGKYYKGGTIRGVGKVYSSDPEWPDKVCQLMNQIKEYLES